MPRRKKHYFLPAPPPRPSTGTYYVPRDLARYVERSWPHIAGSGEAPSLPSPKALLGLIECCYHASLESEEGRLARLMVIFSPAQNPPQRYSREMDVPALRFGKPRQLSTEELRRLSAASHTESTAVWVSPHDKDPKLLSITGLLHIGPSWTSARKGYAAQYLPPPNALIVRALGPGRIDVYQGPYLVARLASGLLTSRDTNRIFDLAPIHPFSHEGIELLAHRLQRPKTEPVKEWANYELESYINTILGIVNTIHGLNHGGTLALCRKESAESISSNLRIKYPLLEADQPLRESFVHFLNKRHEWGDNFSIDDQYRSRDDPEAQLLSLRVSQASQELAQSIALTGRLAGADGAIVLNSDLSLIGFGAEILSGPAHSIPVVEAQDPLIDDVINLDPEQFGMRHRSAVRLVASTPGVVAYVISQDGTISVVWRESDLEWRKSDRTRIIVRKGISAVNIDMPLS